MSWNDFVGKAFVREDFVKYLASLEWKSWKPKGITIHNTAAPTLAQWAEVGPAHDARIKNLRNYFELQKRWSGAPHFFNSRDHINVFDGLLEPGVHSPGFNKDYLGIEMVGDFAKEAFNSGDGAKVRDITVFLCALLCKKLGLNPDTAINLHKEDPRTTHDCPGKNVVKADLIARIKAQMSGAPAPMTTPPSVPVVPQGPSIAAQDMRLRMAQAIVDFEARRDSKGRLVVYHPPPNDGGGAYEVAGITQKHNRAAADELVRLIGLGKHTEAEIFAESFIAADTDGATKFTKIPSVQCYLRDTIFHRGLTGGTKILQRALGVKSDGMFGPISTKAMRAAEKNPQQLLDALRTARETYERNVIGYRANFWKGFINRWNNALKVARTFPDAPVV